MTHPRSNSARDDFFSRYRRPGQGGVAKYAQLRDAIVTAIRAGHWKPGDRLPTEAELTQLTPFSLGTVQRALRALVDEGLVVRAQGSGSYAAESRGPIDVPLHLRFLGGPGEPRYLPLYPKVLGRRRIAARGPWSEWLGQTGDEIVCVDRRLGVNGEFDLYNRFHFSAASFPEIAGKPLAALDGANLKQLLGASFAVPDHQRAAAGVDRRVSAGGDRRAGAARGDARAAAGERRQRGAGQPDLLPGVVHSGECAQARCVVRRRRAVAHSAVAPELRTALPHLPISLATKRSNCGPVLGAGSEPRSRM